MVGARVVIDGVLAVGGRAGGVVEGTVRPGQKEDIGKILSVRSVIRTYLPLVWNSADQ